MRLLCVNVYSCARGNQKLAIRKRLLTIFPAYYSKYSFILFVPCIFFHYIFYTNKMHYLNTVKDNKIHFTLDANSYTFRHLT